MFDSAGDRQPVGLCHPDTHLIVPGVGGLVAEQHQVELAAVDLQLFDRVHDGGGRGLRIGLGQTGLHPDRGVSAHRERIPQLLVRLRPADREHGDRTAVLSDDPDGLLDRALLVWADRETEVPCVDRLAVIGQRDRRTGARNSFDADQYLHGDQLFIRVSSGSNRGVRPLRATVTGYRSPMYSTVSLVPSSAYSVGR